MMDYGSGAAYSKCRLRRTNNTVATLAVGVSVHLGSSYIYSASQLVGKVVLTAGDTIELQGWCNGASAKFGDAASTDESEIYSTIDFSRQ